MKPASVRRRGEAHTDLFRSAAGAAAVHDAYQDLLERFLPFAEQRIVPTSAGDTFVLSAGPRDGPALVLLHGSGSVAAAWAPEITTLSRTHRVHAVDLLGESGHSAPHRAPLRPGVHAPWLHEVMSALDAVPAAVMGVSLGGWIALDHATSFPDAVTDLVLFAPSGIGRRRLGPLLVAGLLGALGDPGRRHALAVLLGPGAPASSDFHRALASLALLTSRHFRPRTDPIATFSDEQLVRLPGAVTAVFGARDRMIRAREAAERLRRLHPRSRVLLLPHRGHLVPEQASYLDRLESRGRPRAAASGAVSVVFLPGLAGHPDEFAAQVTHLGAVRRVITSRPVVDGDTSVAGAARRLVADLRRDGVERFVLVGHSAGGVIALAAAQQQPDGLAGVALLDTPVLLPTPAQVALRLLTVLLRTPLAGPLLRFVVRATFSDSDLAPFRRALLQRLAETPAHAARSLIRTTFTHDSATALASVPVPVLVVRSTIPIRVDQLPATARWIDVRGAGHWAHVHAADRVNTALGDFLDGLDGR